MTDAVPLLARQLKARRCALGVSQEEMAARLGVDRVTVWRWENGKAIPKSRAAIEAVKGAYGCTQGELNRWFAGETPETAGHTGYAMSGYEFLSEHGLTLGDLVERVLVIDAELIPGIDQADLGSHAQWVPVFLESPVTWRLLTRGSEVVGYWQYLCLTRQAFQRMKDGMLRDGEISREMIEFPVPLTRRRTYRMYIVMFGIVPAHQTPAAEGLLLRDFTAEIARLADEGVFFSEIATVAFSAKSAYLCRELGMRSVGTFHYRLDGEVGEVFHIEGPEIATARLIRHDRTLADGYRKRFAGKRILTSS